jgi:hypothetical protein
MEASKAVSNVRMEHVSHTGNPFHLDKDDSFTRFCLIIAMKTLYHVNMFQLPAADAKLFGWNTPHII